MSDAHDLHTLNDLIAAIRATEGAPPAAAETLEPHSRQFGAAETVGEGLSVIEAAREALGGLIGGGGAAPEPGLHDAGRLQRLAALMARMEAAMADDRLSGPARDAVTRAFDPVKAACGAALQQQSD